MLSLAQTTGDVPFTVDGTVTIGGSLLSVGVPYHLDGTVTHAQLVSTALRGLGDLGGLLPK